jgi:hypothetical protein
VPNSPLQEMEVVPLRVDRGHEPVGTGESRCHDGELLRAAYRVKRTLPGRSGESRSASWLRPSPVALREWLVTWSLGSGAAAVVTTTPTESSMYSRLSWLPSASIARNPRKSEGRFARDLRNHTIQTPGQPQYRALKAVLES